MNFKERVNEDLSKEEVLELTRAFHASLENIFSDNYLYKIDKKINKNIRFVEKDFKDPSKAAYTKGRTIYINSPVFDRLNTKERTKYLLHEFIHVIQNTKNYFIFRTFKEVYDVGVELYKIVKKNLKGSLGEFLTGRNQKISFPHYEIISYLMNGEIDWDKITNEGREEFIKTLGNSGLFKMSTKFWEERLL